MVSDNEKIIRVDIEQTMQTAYIDYAMSVIVSRALPDVRDGMKPVHRRILYAMNDMNLFYNSSYKKSASVVGEVLGKYHPHGDSSVYGALARLAQTWNMRYPLVDGQGNFGSIDGDGPAAMRYTEVRMEQMSNEILADIKKETVDMMPTYDNDRQEPTVLPTKIPNLLINGSNGIAVGMATNMPTHNLREVLNGCIAYIDNNDITIDELMHYITAPDFPLGGVIYGYNGVREAYTTGRGSIILRADTTMETDNQGHNVIVATSVPYGVNKAEMHKRQAQLVKEKKIEGILDIRDESDKNGIRMVYILRNDAVPNVVLNKLFQLSELQSSFAVNNIALVHGRPMQLNLKDLIRYFVDHRVDVVTRRTRFEMAEAERRAHILQGFLKAIDIIDEIIALIRRSKTAEEARQGLVDTYQFSEEQASAIVEMRLRQLTGLERQRLQEEYDEKLRFIERCKSILSDRSVLMQVIKDEFAEIRDKYGDDRRTSIKYDAANFRVEDTIPDDEVVVTISSKGYIKRTRLDEYRTQNRGGVGSKGSSLRSEDYVEHIFMATNHNYLLLFTEKGRCYWMRVFEIPEGDRTSKGRPVLNMVNIASDDKIKTYINVKTLSDNDYINNNSVVLSTKNGLIKKTTLAAYSHPRSLGIIAINIREGDELLTACLVNEKSEILLATKQGKMIRFQGDSFRSLGRNSSGVRGVKLEPNDDAVIGMLCVNDPNDEILVVSANGYGKRSALSEYRSTNRGAKGVKAMNVTDKTGALTAIANVNEEQDIMIINRSGITIRLAITDIRACARATQGVKLINLRGKDFIASVTTVPHDDSEPTDKPVEGVALDTAEEAPVSNENTDNSEE